MNSHDILHLWPAIEEFRLKISVPTAFRWLCGAAVALKVEVSYACVIEGERVETILELLAKTFFST